MTVSENTTKNQHYVSQVEQRRNAIDGVPHRIFDFSIVDPSVPSLKRGRPDGVSVKKNLSGEDMFSLSVQGKTRENFEEAWNKYEVHHGDYVDSPLAKIKGPNNDIRREYLSIVALKMLGLVRSPHVAPLIPRYNWKIRNPQLARSVEMLSTAPLPECCALYNVSHLSYQRWMGFLLLGLQDFVWAR